MVDRVVLSDRWPRRASWRWRHQQRLERDSTRHRPVVSGWSLGCLKFDWDHCFENPRGYDLIRDDILGTRFAGEVQVGDRLLERTPFRPVNFRIKYQKPPVLDVEIGLIRQLLRYLVEDTIQWVPILFIVL